MGWIVAVLVLAFIGSAILVGASNVRSANAELGASPAEIHRVVGLGYLGGHPDLPAPLKMCWLVVTPDEVAIQRSSSLLVRVPMGEVVGLEVETEQEVRRRITATRVAAFNIFALAMPKKTPGSVLVTLETERGPFMFERERVTKPEMLRQMAPALAVVSAEHGGTLPLAASGPVADELAKLVALREAGELTAEEFVAQKARLLGP